MDVAAEVGGASVIEDSVSGSSAVVQSARRGSSSKGSTRFRS